MLRKACDYLCQGLKPAGSAIEQKVDADKMQNVDDAGTAGRELAEDRCHLRNQ